MTIIYADIVGDLFHWGHIKMFEQAKKYGDYLIIGVCSDKLVESYKRKPIMSTNERVVVIANCKYVDKVVIDPPCPITKEFIEEHSIDFVVHGDDMDDEELNKWYGEAIKQGKFIKTKYTPTVSTSDIIRRVLSRYSS